jgi:hypothetical protein
MNFRVKNILKDENILFYSVDMLSLSLYNCVLVKKGPIGARLTGWAIVNSGGCAVISVWSVS